MKNTQTIVLQGVVRISADMNVHMVVDDIPFLLIGTLSLRTGDCIHAVGVITGIDNGRIVVKCALTHLETIDSREQSA